MYSIHAEKKLFPEIEKELDTLGIDHNLGVQVANSVDIPASDIILIAAGAVSTLLVQAITTWMKKGHGQRKVSVQTHDSEDRLTTISVETPDIKEIEKLIEMSQCGTIHLTEEKVN
ncbi:hypothetical protein P4E94_19485 [Pontiellaceae bacterium B12219]|nr:hypothetical protein [Pontiellaceae bacterium B12219]